MKKEFSMKKYLFLEKYLRGDYYRKIIANGRPTFSGLAKLPNTKVKLKNKC